TAGSACGPCHCALPRCTCAKDRLTGRRENLRRCERPMDALKLVALDEQDLRIVSAHVQDAVIKVGELEYLPRLKRFVIPMRRFAWEVKSGFLRQRNERRQSVLHFDRVLGVKSAGIRRDKPDDALSLLAVSFV